MYPKAGRDIYKNAQEVGKEVLSNPEELKKRLENRLKEDLDKLPQRLVDTIDDMANKNPLEVVVDNLVGRAESIVDTTETVVGMATTPSETFDDIYGDGTSSTVETVGLTTGAIGAVIGSRSKIDKLASSVPKKFKKNYSCQEFANSFEDKLKKEGIKGEVIELQSPTSDLVTANGKNISTNGYHKAIKVGDKVYDNNNPNGVDYKKWLEDLGADDDIYGIKIKKKDF